MSNIADEINALPQRLRDYIHHLETDADPSGTIRENFRLREENTALRAECERLSRTDKIDPRDLDRFDGRE